MSLSIENIDVGATINNFFKKIKQNVFHYSLQFKKLADDDQSEKFFRYRATINNLSSNVIMQNKDVTVDLIFDVCGTSVTWLSVKTSTIPNSGKGCFLQFDGNSYLVLWDTRFRRQKRASTLSEILNPAGNQKKIPFYGVSHISFNTVLLMMRMYVWIMKVE
jgi:hypothetical protein